MRPGYRVYTCVRVAAVLLLAGALAGCDDDDDNPYHFIGSACDDDFDCAPGVDCERAGDLPDGTCTLPCRGHLDCPEGTACIDVHGGLCLILCGHDLHCRPGYRCRSRDDRGDNFESFVCID